jgi:hypothetical protein
LDRKLSGPQYRYKRAEEDKIPYLSWETYQSSMFSPYPENTLTVLFQIINAFHEVLITEVVLHCYNKIPPYEFNALYVLKFTPIFKL